MNGLSWKAEEEDIPSMEMGQVKKWERQVFLEVHRKKNSKAGALA